MLMYIQNECYSLYFINQKLQIGLPEGATVLLRSDPGPGSTLGLRLRHKPLTSESPLKFVQNLPFNSKVQESFNIQVISRNFHKSLLLVEPFQKSPLVLELEFRQLESSSAAALLQPQPRMRR